MIEITHGKFRIQGGVKKKLRGRNSICPICECECLAGQGCAKIHPVGESPKEFHYSCLTFFSGTLNKFLMDMSEEMKKYADKIEEKN